jgi:hypothetical protein
MDPYVHLPRTAAELDEGWTVAEHTQLTSPGGVVVTVSVTRAPDGADAAALAELDRAGLEPELADLEVTASDVRAFGGLEAHELRFSFTRDGAPHAGRIVDAVAGEVACRAAASWPRDHADAASEVDAAIAGIRLIGGPLGMPGLDDGGDGSPAVALPARPAFDRAQWSGLQASWASANGVEPQVAVEPWSPDELAVVAVVLGAPAFPTVPGDVLVALPDVARQALVGAIVRSMMARGTLVPAGGRLGLPDPVRGPMEVAVSPDVVIEVECQGRDGGALWWYGVRPDAAVRVSVTPTGAREVGPLEPGEVLSDLIGQAGLSGSEASSAGSTVEASTLLVEGSGIRAVGSVRTTWRDGSTMVGGIVWWAEADDGSLALAEVEGTTWVLRPASSGDLRAELLAHLPG